MLSAMPGIAIERVGRKVVYTCTTTPSGQTGGKGPGDHIADMIADMGAGNDSEGDPSLLWLFAGDGDGFPDILGPDNSGHDCGHRPRNPDNCGHPGGWLWLENASFPDLDKPRYGDRTFQARPEEERVCRTCPLTFASFERDAIQYVIIDSEFANLLMEHAEQKHWERRECDRSAYIYLPHLTFQVGGDTVTIYSDEPGDLEWIAGFVEEEFAADHPDIPALLNHIRRPENLSRDELTVVVNDTNIIGAFMETLEVHMSNGVFYIRSPNRSTPSFKVYLSGDTLRLEFDARNRFQAVSALSMRHELMDMLTDIGNSPGLFYEFLKSYYNPAVQPIIIELGLDRFLRDALEGFTEKKPAPDPVHESVSQVAARLEDGMAGEEISALIAEEFGLSGEVADVYLAAWSVWVRRRFKGQVLIEDVEGLLEQVGVQVDVPVALQSLIEAGLMKDDPGLEICFSREGVRLGRKIGKII